MSQRAEGTIRVGVAGVLGRMGQAVAAQVDLDSACTLAGGIVRPGSDLSASGSLRLETSAEALVPDIDVLIDVSLPNTTGRIADVCAAHGTPLVCGVTGLDDATMEVLRTASGRIPVWYARNLSHGVGVLMRLLPELASAFEGYDISIVERHHRHKRDAPSGTALALERAMLGDAEAGSVDIQSVRAGGITGEHDVTFTNAFEEIRVSHRALDRAAFASGAVRAARSIRGAPPGWYGPE